MSKSKAVAVRTLRLGFAASQGLSDALSMGFTIWDATAKRHLTLAAAIGSGLVSFSSGYGFQGRVMERYLLNKEAEFVEGSDKRYQNRMRSALYYTLSSSFLVINRIQELAFLYFLVRDTHDWIAHLVTGNDDIRYPHPGWPTMGAIIAYYFLIDFPYQLFSEDLETIESLAHSLAKPEPTFSAIGFMGRSNKLIKLWKFVGSLSHTIGQHAIPMLVIIPTDQIHKVYAENKIAFGFATAAVTLTLLPLTLSNIAISFYFYGNHFAKNIRQAYLSSQDHENLTEDSHDDKAPPCVKQLHYSFYAQGVIHGIRAALPVIAVGELLGFHPVVYWMVGLLTCLLGTVGIQFSEVQESLAHTAKFFKPVVAEDPEAGTSAQIQITEQLGLMKDSEETETTSYGTSNSSI